MKKNIITTLLLVTIMQVHAEVTSKENFSEKVAIVAIIVKDIVTDTAQTVKLCVSEGAEVAKGFLASTAANFKIKMEEARAKQAEQKAHYAREECEKAQQELNYVQEQLKQAKTALNQMNKQPTTR